MERVPVFRDHSMNSHVHFFGWVQLRRALSVCSALAYRTIRMSDDGLGNFSLRLISIDLERQGMEFNYT